MIVLYNCWPNPDHWCHLLDDLRIWTGHSQLDPGPEDRGRPHQAPLPETSHHTTAICDICLFLKPAPSSADNINTLIPDFLTPSTTAWNISSYNSLGACSSRLPHLQTNTAVFMSFLLSRAKMRSNSSGMSRTAFIAWAILTSSYHSLWKYNGIAYASTESICFSKQILVCSFADIYRVWHGLASQTTLVEDSGCDRIMKHIL